MLSDEGRVGAESGLDSLTAAGRSVGAARLALSLALRRQRSCLGLTVAFMVRVILWLVGRRSRLDLAVQLP